MGSISSQVHVTVAAGGFSSIPGIILCIWIVDKYGRKKSLIATSIITALALLSLLPLPKGAFPHDWPRIVLAAVALVAISVSSIQPYVLHLC